MRVLGLALIAFACGGCKPQAPKVAHAVDGVWEPIVLAEAIISPELGAEKAFVLVDVNINGRVCRAQLDTGANGSIIWHDASDEDLSVKEKVIVVALGLKKVSSASPRLQEKIVKCDPNNATLTLGNAFFERGTLSLDLQNARARYRAGSMLNNGFPFVYHRQEIGGHMLAKARLPNDTDDKIALFDTGSARFGFVFAKLAEFEKATAHLADAAKRQYSVQAWGKQIPCVETKDHVAVKWGDTEQLMRLAHCAQDFLETSGLDGLIGLAPFFGKTVIQIDYPAQKIAFESAGDMTGATR